MRRETLEKRPPVMSFDVPSAEYELRAKVYFERKGYALCEEKRAHASPLASRNATCVASPVGTFLAKAVF